MTRAIGINGVPRIAVGGDPLQVTIPEVVEPWQEDTEGNVRLDPNKTYAVFVSCAADLYVFFIMSKENPDQSLSDARTDFAPVCSATVPYPGGLLGHLRGCELVEATIGLDYTAPYNGAAAGIWGHSAQLRFVEVPNGSTEDTGMGVYDLVPLD